MLKTSSSSAHATRKKQGLLFETRLGIVPRRPKLRQRKRVKISSAMLRIVWDLWNFIPQAVHKQIKYVKKATNIIQVLRSEKQQASI